LIGDLGFRPDESGLHPRLYAIVRSAHCWSVKYVIAVETF